MIIDINKSNIIIKKNDDIYTIFKKVDNSFDLFIKYADDTINYFIKRFDDLYECLEYIKIGVI